MDFHLEQSFINIIVCVILINCIIISYNIESFSHTPYFLGQFHFIQKFIFEKLITYLHD